MTKILCVALTVVFVAASLSVTAVSGWLLGEALAPVRFDTFATLFSAGAVMIMLAVIAEGLRLTLALQGERIWRKSQFQGAAFAGPLWLACTAYCTLMPLLALAVVPLLPIGSPILTIGAPVWVFVQIAAGLLPGIAWPVAIPSGPADAAPSHAALPRSSPEMPEVPAHLVPKVAASADDFFQFLARLSELPAGSTLPRRGRIGANREIVMSQAALAALVGRSKPTVRRWLQELERGERITKSATGILLQQHMQYVNGDARV